MSIQIQIILLSFTTLYQALANWYDHRQSPPGQFIDLGGYCLHLYGKGEAKPGLPTIILDHSLGGVEGYLLMEELSQFTRVYSYDRAGYGYSDPSPNPRTSVHLVHEFDRLLSLAQIEPPYLLIGDSFGSYNMRLYAHVFPEKVVGLVLTDGLHETGMLSMPWSLRLLQGFFLSGFLMSTLGSGLGLVRLVKSLGGFELLKPELGKFPRQDLRWVKRSFCLPLHWLTMAREIWNLDRSGRQLAQIGDLGDLPIVNIKAKDFLKPTPWNFYMPLRAANQLRDHMHEQLMTLSSRCTQLQADASDHFIWIDQPDLMVRGVALILQMIAVGETN
jgi:pimeloyl-ACP methyl ester carboxylesterase